MAPPELRTTMGLRYATTNRGSDGRPEFWGRIELPGLGPPDTEVALDGEVGLTQRHERVGEHPTMSRYVTASVGEHRISLISSTEGESTSSVPLKIYESLGAITGDYPTGERPQSP